MPSGRFFLFDPLAVCRTFPDILAFVVLQHVHVAVLFTRPSFNLPPVDADILIDLIELFLRHRHSEPMLCEAQRGIGRQWKATLIDLRR